MGVVQRPTGEGSVLRPEGERAQSSHKRERVETTIIVALIAAVQVAWLGVFGYTVYRLVF